MGTETDRNRLQLIPKRTSMGTRKGRVGYDRDDPNTVMYRSVSVPIAVRFGISVGPFRYVSARFGPFR